MNWATAIDLDPESESYGRPLLDPAYSTDEGGDGEDVNHEGICPARSVPRTSSPPPFRATHGLFYVPLTHVCMDFEPFQVNYTAGQPYVGATLKLYPDPKRPGAMGGLMAYDPKTGKPAFEIDERFSVWSGVLATGGGLVFYGTLEGYLKAIDARTGKELWRFKTPSGIVGNVTTYAFEGRQYVAVLSGVGGWAGIGLAAGTDRSARRLRRRRGLRGPRKFTAPGGVLTVFALP